MDDVVLSVLAVVVGVPLGLLLVVWAGQRMLRDGSGAPSSGNPFGGFDVFEPARERGEQDLESKRLEVSLAPSPEDDDRPVRVDTDAGTVHVRRPRGPAPGASSTGDPSTGDRG